MTDTKTLAADLRQFNRWRRGDESLQQPEPYKISVMLDQAADRLEELEETRKDYLCLAELLDGHDATECRARLLKMKDDLEQERALADRLAETLANVQGDYASNGALVIEEVDAALASWQQAPGKEA